MMTSRVWSAQGRTAVVIAAGVALLAAACSSSGSSTAVSSNAKQTIVFAESGLGTEGAADADGHQRLREGQPQHQGQDRRAVVGLDDVPVAAGALVHRRVRPRRTSSSPTSPTRPSSRRPAGSEPGQPAPEHEPVLPARRSPPGTYQGKRLRGAVVRQPGGALLPDRPDQDPADEPGPGRLRRQGCDEEGPVAQGGPRLRGRQVRGRDHRLPDRRLGVRRQARPQQRQHAGQRRRR